MQFTHEKHTRLEYIPRSRVQSHAAETGCEKGRIRSIRYTQSKKLKIHYKQDINGIMH